MKGQHWGAGARIGRRPRHSPYYTRSFILRDHAGAGSDDLLAAAHPVRAHAGQHDGQNAALPNIDRGGEQWVDRGLAEIDRRSIVESDHGIAAMPRDAQMAAPPPPASLARLHRLSHPPLSR